MEPLHVHPDGLYCAQVGAYVPRSAPDTFFCWHEVLDAIMYREIPSHLWEGFSYYWQQRGMEARSKYDELKTQIVRGDQEALLAIKKQFLDFLLDTEKDEVTISLSAYLRCLGIEANVFQEFRTEYSHPRYQPRKDSHENN